MAIVIYPFTGCCGASIWWCNNAALPATFEQDVKEAAAKTASIAMIILTNAQIEGQLDRLSKIGFRKTWLEPIKNARYGVAPGHDLHGFYLNVDKYKAGTIKPLKMRLFGR